MTKPLKDLGQRTAAEELWLARKAAGRTQAEEARRRGLGRNTYVGAEAGLNPGPKAARRRVRPPTLAELLRLARRRSGKGLAALAGRLGVSRVTWLLWERAADARIRGFWEKGGFRFPGGG